MGYSTHIGSYIDMEQNPSNLTRKSSNMVKKLWGVTFWVIWARFVGYNSDKRTLVILFVKFIKLNNFEQYVGYMDRSELGTNNLPFLSNWKSTAEQKYR